LRCSASGNFSAISSATFGKSATTVSPPVLSPLKLEGCERLIPATRRRGFGGGGRLSKG
jgi:hypothetical protein